MTRDYRLDNLKGFLIYLVVLGHLITIGFRDDSVAAKYLYEFIYSFHMPAFFMISGYLSQRSAERGYKPAGMQKLLVSYIFGILVVIAVSMLTIEGKSFASFICPRPVFAMWFMLCLIYMRLTAGWLYRIRFVVPLTIAVAIAAGCLSWIGADYGFGRLCGNLQFFVAGLKLAENGRLAKIREYFAGHKAVMLAGYALVLAAYIRFVTATKLKFSMMWMFTDYESAGYSDSTGMMYRAVIIAFAMITSIMLMTCFPAKKCFLTHLGETSLTVYLLHTAVYYCINSYYKTNGFPVEGAMPLIALMCITAVVVAVLSSPPLVKTVNLVIDTGVRLTVKPSDPGKQK